jgi:hypothetical protein
MPDDIDPTFLAALDRAVELTHIGHYRHLCLEHPSPKIRAQYRGLIVDIANGTHAGQQVATSGRSCCGGVPLPD